MKKYRIIIAGGRHFSDHVLLDGKVSACVGHLPIDDVEFVDGGASGADKLGHRWAVGRGYQTKTFPADFKGLGRKAGPIRNRQMGEYATHLIAFWDGESRGTKNMIETAQDLGLTVRVIRYDTK